MIPPRSLILFIAPFSMGRPGGAARLMRRLIEPHPERALFLNSEAHLDSAHVADLKEEPLCLRPTFGRLEKTRFRPSLDTLELLLIGLGVRRVVKMVAQRKWPITAIHVIAHSADFWVGYKAARRLRLPIYMSIHDDILHTRPSRWFEKRIRHVWQNADGIVSISNEMGELYCERFGRREYTVVSDGTEFYDVAQNSSDKFARAYYFGLLHLSYIPNFISFLEALRRSSAHSGQINARVGSLPRDLQQHEGNGLTLLPYVSFDRLAETTRKDLATTDVLYFPLPTDSAHDSFVKYSLSTKLISYLGMGRPILYHGPFDSAAASLLRTHQAAEMCYSLEPDAIAGAFANALRRSAELSENARRLGEIQFDLARQRAAFWNCLSRPEIHIQ